MAYVNLKGLKYPLEVKNGRLVTVEGAELVRSWINHFLDTFQGERIYFKDFGIPDKILSADIDVIAPAIEFALTKYIPAATYQVVSTFIELEGTLQITIYWAFEEVPQSPILFRITP